MLKATERLERLVSMVPWLIENNGADTNILGCFKNRLIYEIVIYSSHQAQPCRV